LLEKFENKYYKKKLNNNYVLHQLFCYILNKK